jgi:hypothetical protein
VSKVFIFDMLQTLYYQGLGSFDLTTPLILSDFYFHPLDKSLNLRLNFCQGRAESPFISALTEIQTQIIILPEDENHSSEQAFFINLLTLPTFYFENFFLYL